MTLISMLLALIIERLAVRSDAWQASGYLRAYVRLSASSGLSKLASHRIGQYIWLALPGAVLALVLCLLDSHLVSLVVNTLVLLLAIGCWHYRQLYKHYLNAMERGDEEAGFLAMQQIRQDSGSREQSSYGQVLVWLNFQYYAAVVFWFLVAGVFGVITYALVRHLQQQKGQYNVEVSASADSDVEFDTDSDDDELAAKQAPEQVSYQTSEQAEAYFRCVPADSKAVGIVAHWLNWFPARLFGLGFALVGHFSRATSTLLSYFLDFTADNELVITEVAAAAEPMPELVVNTIEESGHMLQLAKRNMLFFLALTAMLTLAGWLA
ncbi:regulatory signaling modulator protein AmpE [Rheinheimera salexigens]|uniref:Regulatory signaling modulator protein AmpE n=1 Tax=Rheinheimera salexigens TaxID=1628148 RepID=A0A1E7Q4E3_9GAMM|nr:regulatory signaling modulator protein AmpE [Rheinheimera salexigens]OEY68918.1 regulatory signaling modulator protein AmpE [Rheinheimera salexigens]